MLDLRLRALDARRAGPLLARQLSPRVTLEDGTALSVPVAPKLGALRQTTAAVRADSLYFVLFANPAKRVRSGDRVGVELGGMHMGEVVVQ
jgi:hypothetical protein